MDRRGLRLHNDSAFLPLALSVGGNRVSGSGGLDATFNGTTGTICVNGAVMP